MNRTRLARIAAVATLAAAASALPVTVPTAATAATKTVTITIEPNGIVHGFSPSKLSISRGTSVVVVNKDSMRHTMTSVAKNKAGNPLFNTAINGGAKATIKGVSGLAAGTYKFYCSIHPNMRGTLIVKGKPGGTHGSGPDFALPLAVPRQLSGSHITMPVERANVRSLPTGNTTSMWTFGGSYPGPTIRESAGEATNVTFEDKLPASSGPLSIHLHGDHHSSADDGQPATTTGTQSNVLLEPGSRRTYHYSLTDSAVPTADHVGFDFYHDHDMGHTGRNNWNGLQGMFIVDSSAEAKLDLPSGRYDVPLLVSDRSYTSGNRLAGYKVAGPPPNDTTVGTHILVDGRYLPHLDVSTHRYRLRLLNASNYQSYDFALTGGVRFRQIGTGDGLLPKAVTRSDILLGPAQRADVIVDFGADLHRNIVLESIPSTDHSPGAVGTPTAPIMQFRVTTKTADHSASPTTLLPVPSIDVPTTVSQTWDFGMDGSGSSARWTVNGQPYDPTQVMAKVPRGSTQLWELRNDTDVTHYIHLHEEAWHTVALIAADGTVSAPPAWEDGLADTWRLDPGTAVEVAATFTDYPGVFMIHCHMLGHEDDGMMAQFAVVDPTGPTLPAGYRYTPLSGTHRPLTAGSTRTGTTAGMAAGMAGMTGTEGAAGASRHDPGRIDTAARNQPGSSALAAGDASEPAWLSTLTQLGRSVGLEAGLAVLVVAGLRLRQRRRRP